MLIIVDYGVGNLGSLMNMCKHVGIDAKVSKYAKDIDTASHLLLPGVGSFDYGMIKLKESGLIESLNNAVLINKTPILGICLGMQLMTNSSEEGDELGLRWIDAETKRIPASNELKVPHMGWSRIIHQRDSKLTVNYSKEERFYFVHSYYVSCMDSSNCVAKVNYGLVLDVMFEKGNIFGVQFHPEKSHKFGMNILKNFSSI